MLSLMRRCEANNIMTLLKIMRHSSSSSKGKVDTDDDIEFPVLNVKEQNKESNKKTLFRVFRYKTPKAQTMSVDQDWQAVWPAARTFQPYTVPLPMKQGYKNKKGIHPDKYATTELMKIPNFLHLTPPVIEKHCQALKSFCSKWPAELQTDEECEKHFPVEIISSNYCYSSPTIREPLARIVSLRVKLSSLHLDEHAKDKMLRLLGDKYNPQTDIITITADRCPVRKQNLDYVNYLLTALFHISWRSEPWENEKSEADMEYYDWDTSKSKKSLAAVYNWPNSSIDCNYEIIPCATEYKTAVSNLMNKGENQSTLDNYKEAVQTVLNLKFHDNTR